MVILCVTLRVHPRQPYKSHALRLLRVLLRFLQGDYALDTELRLCHDSFMEQQPNPSIAGLLIFVAAIILLVVFYLRRKKP